MAVDMLKEKLIKKEEAVMRVTPAQLDELLHPIIDPKVEKDQKILGKGLPAGPGGATGQVVFTANEAVAWAKSGKKVILVREETNPEDVEGMRAAQAILTARGGMTSHAALVARGWGKCCIVGCGALHVDLGKKEFGIGGQTFREGDWITMNGSKGNVYAGQLPMMDAGEENVILMDFLKICDAVKRLGVRTNAETPADAAKARAYGAQGIGLFRTEHMFYGKGSDEPLFILRKMIMSKTAEERKKAVDELFPYVKRDIKGTMEVMDGLPVVVRLLDPPLHEFVPQDPAKQQALAKALSITMEDFTSRAEGLHESNPMMGHRGVPPGHHLSRGHRDDGPRPLRRSRRAAQGRQEALPELMIPVVCDANEIKQQKEIVAKAYKETCAKFGIKKMKHMVGTMIEIPRAALLSGQIAEVTEFFSFGTNDLTQMTFGFSRDDIGGFLPDYVSQGILPTDPFQTIDQSGVGELIKFSVDRGRKANKNLEIGICGEQGGEPASVAFCHKVGLDYVSCSPFRVPIARLAAAQAAVSK